MVRLRRFLFCFAASAALGGAAIAEIPVGGQVLGPGGRGLKGVRVGLEPIPPDFERVAARLDGDVGPGFEVEASTDADGFFELSAPRLGAWKVVVGRGEGEAAGATGYVAEEHLLRPLSEPVELPPVELQPAAVVEIKVLDENGSPVDARLGLVDARRRTDGWRSCLRLAETGEDGVARLPLGAAEEPRLEVLGHSHPLVIFSGGEVPADGSVELKLPPGGVAGTAVATDREGRRIAGAVAYQGGGIVPLGRTDEEGRLALVVAPPEHEPPGVTFVTRDGDLGQLEPRFSPDGTNEAAVVLEPLPTVRGRVVDVESRDPVAGALVWVPGGPVTESDARGEYELRLFPSTRLIVQAVAEGYAMAVERKERQSAGLEDGPTLALAPAATVSGSVVDPEGRPLPGVDVTVQSASSVMAFRSPAFRGGAPGTRTTRRGRFFLSGLAPSSSYELRFQKPGFAPTRYVLEGLDAFEDRSGVVVVLETGRSGAGRVVDQSDAPVAGAEVRLVAVSSGRSSNVVYSIPGEDEAPAASTDAEGRFRLAHLAAGRYNLEVKAAGFAPFTVPGLAVEAGSGEEDFGTVVLAPGARIEGVVRDPQGSPLAEAEIRLSQQNAPFFPREPEPVAKSDATGRFVIADLEAGKSYLVLVKKPGYSSETTNAVAREGAIVKFVLRPAGAISGWVVNEEGDPVEGALVEARTGHMRAFSGQRHARTDERGSFRLEDVDPGAVDLWVTAQGYQMYRRHELTVPSNGEASGVEIVLVRGATITGTVTRGDGTPVVQATISYAPAQESMFGGGIQMSGATDAEGRFRIDGVAPGPAVISAGLGGQGQVSKSVELRAGPQTVDLVFADGFEVSGRVSDAAGAPVAGAALSLTATDASRTRFTMGPAQPVSTGADGTFTLKDVAAGYYLLQASKEGYAPAATPEPFEVANGPVAGIELMLRRGVTLRGRILGIEADELATVMVQAFGGSAAGYAQTGVVDFEGRYSVQDLGPGSWYVTARMISGRQATAELKVEEGQTEAELDLEFKTGFDLEGVVTSAGQPQPGIQVTASGMGVGLGHGQGTTDSGGRFRIAQLPAGKYRLMAFGGTVQHFQDVEVPADGEVVVELGTQRITGHVLDETGEQALAGAAVRIERLEREPTELGLIGSASHTETDSRGYFSLNAGEAVYRVVATKAGYGPSETTVEVGGASAPQGVELRMSPTEGISFDVLLDTGVAPAQVMAAVIDPAGRVVTKGFAPVEEGGTVRLSTVPNGVWELAVQAGDSAVVRTQITAPGYVGRIVLPRGGTLRIKVPALSSEQPGPGRMQFARARLVGPDGRPQYLLESMMTEVRDWPVLNGEAVIGRLVPGLWKFTISHPDGRSWTGEAVVTAGETSEVVVP